MTIKNEQQTTLSRKFFHACEIFSHETLLARTRDDEEAIKAMSVAVRFLKQAFGSVSAQQNVAFEHNAVIPF